MGLIIPDANDLKQVVPPEYGLSLPRAIGACEQLGCVAKAGFRSVELDGDEGGLADPRHMAGLSRDHLRKTLRECELRADSLRTGAVLRVDSKQARHDSREALRRAIELSGDLACPLAAVGAGRYSLSNTDAAKHALDLAHDVADDLLRSGVRLAIEDGDGLLVSDPASRALLLANLPGGAAIAASAGCLGESGLQGQGKSFALARLAASEDREGKLRLDNAPLARKLLAELARTGFQGRLLATARLDWADGRELRRLYEELAAFVPAAFLNL